MKTPVLLFTSILILSSLLSAAPAKQAANGKLKVFILAGQSNMVGFGQVEGDKPGTMETCVKEKPNDYGQLVNDQGEPVTRDDVWLAGQHLPCGQSQARLADYRVRCLGRTHRSGIRLRFCGR